MSVRDARQNELCESATESGRYRQEVKQHLRRNYLAHGVEGGLYMGGMAFLSADTIMPKIIHSLHGPEFLISLMPILGFIGFSLPPIFTAYRIERLDKKMPLVTIAGFFQRMPFLIAGLLLLFVGAEMPVLTVTAVVLAPLLSGMIGGGSFPGWLELVAKTIPPNRRSSLWAFRYIIAAFVGIGAGMAVETIMKVYPGISGYAFLHLSCFGFLVLSYIVFIMIRETNLPPDKSPLPTSFRDHLRSLPSLVRKDPQLGRYLIIRFLAAGVFVMIPFLSIHALQVSGMEEYFLGELVSMKWIGGILGNLLAAYLGDRYGGKGIFALGTAMLILVCAVASLVTSAIGFSVIFFIYGFAFYINRVGVTTLNFDICPDERRTTYMALVNAVGCPSMLFAALLCWILRWQFDSFWPAALVAALMMMVSLGLLTTIREPRQKKHP